MDQHSFLFQAMIYLAAAVVMVPVAKKLGLGSVLGYLLAGIIIGPAVMGFIGKEGQDIMHFAEFGVIMMLFLIGLELEPALLWKLRKPILGLGGLQVALCTIIITGIGILFGLNWQAALALGLTLSVSSTAIVLQTLEEKGLMQTVSGQSSFSVLLFQDIAVIPMLALMPLLATGATQVATDTDATWVSSQAGWLQTLIVIGSVSGLIIGGRFLIRPVLQYIASTRLRELFTAAALLLVVGITVLMTQVGLSPALGTFLAGVILANSEYKHELESDIEPFKGLLLGLFFIAVGASINFGLVLQQPLLIIGLVLLLMTIKAIVLFILGKMFKLSLDQNLIFSFALCQVGEFAFVLISFSLQQNILNQEQVSLMLAVVAITMALTPVVMLIAEKFVLPKMGTEEADEKKADTVNERNPVIIAGFDRFGNIVGRFLRANGIKATVLDYNSDRVDILRRMGLKVYYGDPTRYDLLNSAGAKEAQIIVIAIEDAGQRLEMVETVKKHFPHLHIVVRAADYDDTFDLMDAGILHIYRETVDTSLRMAVDIMHLLGYRTYSAYRASQKFFTHDQRSLKTIASHRWDDKQYISVVRQHIEELEDMIRADASETPGKMVDGWDNVSLKQEANSV